jgi:hypothetical protein
MGYDTNDGDNEDDHVISSNGKVRVKRASLKYKKDGGQDIEELQIENDRMKTTLMILT